MKFTENVLQMLPLQMHYFLKKLIMKGKQKKISILPFSDYCNPLINERYTCEKIGARGIQIRGEVGPHVLCFWTLVTEVKYLGCLHIENIKKTASTELLMYIRLNVTC